MHTEFDSTSGMGAKCSTNSVTKESGMIRPEQAAGCIHVTRPNLAGMVVLAWSSSFHPQVLGKGKHYRLNERLLSKQISARWFC
jgi:hypothetical protein